MENKRLRTLPADTKVQNTAGGIFTVVVQNGDDTLLKRDEGFTKFVVVWQMLTSEKYYPEDFIHGTFYPSTGSTYIPIPEVTWNQGHYFGEEDEAIKAMQERGMRRSGKKMCYPPTSTGDDRCPACQYFVSCHE